jgi:hypothetical protein
MYMSISVGDICSNCYLMLCLAGAVALIASRGDSLSKRNQLRWI